MSDSAERIELKVTPEFFDALVGLAKDDERPMVDVIRRAVGLYAHARAELEEGRMIAFATLGSNNTMEITSLVHL